MFDYSSMLKKALEFFPLWSDIRKRKDKSIGGQLVNSALKETLELESAIKDYKDFYFLNKYDGKEDSVMAFAYKANIGKIEKDKLAEVNVYYNSKLLPLTTNIDEFEKESVIAYYEDGYIYLKTDIVKDLLSIDLVIDNDTMSYSLVYTHVWNIFDEYAVFVGLQRHENETNKQLKDRILYAMKNISNGTEEGLKAAIVTELMNITDISKEDISISKATPENLIKPYKEYNSILEMLDKYNKEALKDKRWDMDKWSYSFKSISFLDNVWDDTVSRYQNGIGHDDDLQVVIADSENLTDANIVLYDKSSYKLEKYVQDKNIKKEIKFKLKKYEDVLNAVNAKYSIKASEVIDITNEDIKLNIYENNKRIENRKVEDLYKLGKDVVKVDNSKITDDKIYRLEFYSNGNSDLAKISKAKVIYKNKITGEIEEIRNLLKPAPGFNLNATGELVNTSIKKTVTAVNHFNSQENLINRDNGISLAPNSLTGKGVLNVSGLGLNLLNINIEHELVNMPISLIKQDKYSFWKNDDLVFRYDINQERRFEINTEANKLSFEILDGEADLFIEVDNESNYQKIKAPYVFNYDAGEKAKNIKLLVISNYNGPVKFSNFKYCNHKIDLKLQYGNLIKDNQGYRLPMIPTNNLIVELSSKTNTSPIITLISIGDNLNVKYTTELIEHKPNTERIIDISSNCLTDLLTVNSVGVLQYRLEKYTPATTYKAIKDNAWIRLNLEEYESINEITCKDAAVHITEESGYLYYNLVMKSGQVVNFVTIDGVRNTAVKTVSLENMIKFYFKDFDITTDKVYSNKLCKGLLIEDNDVNNPRMMIVNIKSDMFSGVSSNAKYKLILPNHLTCSFNSFNSQINDTETNIAFDSLSIIPAGTKIYQAINEANIYTEEVRGIKILNNFNPILNTSNLMYYEVSPFDSNKKFEVKFSTSTDVNSSFEVLNNWCVGNKEIAIRTPIDLNNSENYDITEIEIADETLLSRNISIKPSYKLANNTEIFTNKFMVIPEDNCEVVYERYSDNQNINLIIQEELIMEEDGFTKLAYSNIDDLLYLGYSTYDGKNEILINEYKLLKDEGIMLWTDKKLIDQAKKVFIRYTIKNPTHIVLSEDSLYKAIGYDINAYEEINRFNITDINDGYRFDLRQIDNFDKADLVYTKCSSSTFKSEAINNVLIFNKIAKQDTILVKTGYYYVNGREYYLFPSHDSINIENDNNVEFSNVDVSGDEITTFKATNNFVRNSEMLFRGINELYNYDASKNPLQGVSNLKSLTACDSFNSWNTFGIKMFLKDGLNDVGINFSPDIPNGYAYIELTDYINYDEINYLSFWADKTLEVFIGEESKYLNIKFPDSINIKIAKEIVYANSDIREAIISPIRDVKYYLIVKNAGTIDDIILTDKTKDQVSHTKNIDLLGFKIKEEVKSGQKHRVFIDKNTDVVNKGAIITSNGNIKTASNMYWGVSPIKTYDSKDEFAACSSLNIRYENNYICTGNEDGYIKTAPIFLDNPLAIKRLVYKVNEIEFDDMRGVKVQILASNTRSNFVPINTFNSNYGFVFGDQLLKYIKIKIQIPANKYINNFGIYAEYCSTEDNYPKLITPSSGELLTKVFDTQYSNDYKIRDISINNISNINDVELYVQSSKDDYSADVWTSWKRIELDSNLKIKSELRFNKTRFFRFKVLLKTSSASIKINNIDIEVI